MDLSFSEKVLEEVKRLEGLGKDPNQISSIICKQDPRGHNYGIGIMLTAQAKAMGTSSTLMDYAKAELAASVDGDYKNSSALMPDVTKAVLQWQKIPEKYWDRFHLALPSDAGTGAVQTAVQLALILTPGLKTLGIEELGWPAYKAIAKMARVSCQETAGDAILSGHGLLPIYQAGPMNTTGTVRKKELVLSRAKAAAKAKGPVILDRAYTGFEFASVLAQESYDGIMKKSFETQIEPFIQEGVQFIMAISPTKSFVTFSLRPCGLLLVYSPEPSFDKELTLALNTAIRARGSSFEHPLTRAFAKALVKDREKLEAEHKAALQRLAAAESMWRKLVKGTPMEPYFTENYAGLFRNLKTKEGAAKGIYGEHLYPVLANNRCRLNVTGIPGDENLAKKHVSVFSQFCY